jgi:hypothetical protein
MASLAAGDADKLGKLSDKKYKQQAVWFLNAFWDEYFTDDEKREKVYDYCTKMIKLDSRGDEGNELDEFKAHQFLEKTEGALTVAAMRKALKDIDIDFKKKSL